MFTSTQPSKEAKLEGHHFYHCPGGRGGRERGGRKVWVNDRQSRGSKAGRGQGSKKNNYLRRNGKEGVSKDATASATPVDFKGGIQAPSGENLAEKGGERLTQKLTPGEGSRRKVRLDRGSCVRRDHKGGNASRQEARNARPAPRRVVLERKKRKRERDPLGGGNARVLSQSKAEGLRNEKKAAAANDPPSQASSGAAGNDAGGGVRHTGGKGGGQKTPETRLRNEDILRIQGEKAVTLEGSGK